MFSEDFQLNEHTLPLVDEIGRHMPGGFFIYRQEQPEELLYANQAVFDIFGCDGLEDFKELTGFTFKGMVYPDDYQAISESVENQISSSEDNMDYVEYRIVRKDGAVRFVDDYGHYTKTEAYGGVFYVFISDITKKRAERAQGYEVRGAVIEALVNAYNTVWLINDVEEETCSLYHTDLDSVHEEAIRNALSHARYTDTKTQYVATMVAEEDQERMQEQISLPYILEQFEEREQFSVSFLRALETGPRHYRIDFGKVHMPEGRTGVMMGFKDVHEEVLQAEALQATLKEALAAAEQANKAKTTFLSNMSHEIRTPMNAIIGLNNIALNEPDLPEKVEEYLMKIGVSAQHLLGIINDILDMSRIESGRMVIRNEEFSFAKELEQVNTIISGQCKDKGLYYECRTKGTIDDYYIGDAMKLKQVMINILGNAVKFTPKGGSVTFLIEEMSRFDGKVTLRFIIQDSGIGMSEEYLPRLFDAFTQEDSSSTSRFGSTGLGMPITKSIVELMSGHIEVESEKGVGSTFTVTLTLNEAIRTKADLCTDNLDPRDLSVLVIDDDPIACEHAQIVLAQVGISCETCPSGEEGLEMVKVRHARREDYDLVLVDWKMPEMNGVETARQIRSIVGHDMPIIILTSYNWDDVADEAKAAGVDTFVPKPLFAGSVMDEFREAFRRKGCQPGARGIDFTGWRVLLAEDVPINAEIIVMVLGMREIDVDVAENGKIAVDEYLAHPSGYYDAILMDMRMPEMDGLEATRIIRSSGHDDAPNIPIIALTANAFDEDVQQSMQAGLNAHLSKPVEPDALFETLASLVKR